MEEIRSALESDAVAARDLPAPRVPESSRGCVVLKDDLGSFGGMDPAARDPAKSPRIREAPTPDPAPGEALVAVMASAVNHTTVTRASTSARQHQFDLRYLRVHLKRIAGGHVANYREAWSANRLITRGMVHPALPTVFPLTNTGEAAGTVHRDVHSGKVGVLCLAAADGLGVADHEMRARHLAETNRFRTTAAVAP